MSQSMTIRLCNSIGLHSSVEDLTDAYDLGRRRSCFITRSFSREIKASILFLTTSY